jgi:hypothetical protein
MDGSVFNENARLYEVLDCFDTINSEKLKRGEISIEEAKALAFGLLLKNPDVAKATDKVLIKARPKKTRGRPQTIADKTLDRNFLVYQEYFRQKGISIPAREIARGVAEIFIDRNDEAARYKPNKYEREKRIAATARTIENRMSRATPEIREEVRRWVQLGEEIACPHERMRMASDHE